MSGWPDAPPLYDGHKPEREFRSVRDALDWLRLEFSRPGGVHVFEAAWDCGVCGGRFASLADAQQTRCDVPRAA